MGVTGVVSSQNHNKGQFWLQMIVLRDETGASFKTNFESSKSLFKALGLQTK